MSPTPHGTLPLALLALTVACACRDVADVRASRVHDAPVSSGAGGTPDGNPPGEVSSGGRTPGSGGTDRGGPDASSATGGAPEAGAGGAAGAPGSDAAPDADAPVSRDAADAGWTSVCDDLDRVACEAHESCGWSPDANLWPFGPGCYQRCPCGPGASCEIALSETDTCGQILCFPDDALPISCATTRPCEGEPASVCWRQHPEPCGPCDGCIDETVPPVCIVAPDGVRHWAGPFENADLLLQPGWSDCREAAAPGDCG